ncbi:hypothetical protein [Rathayibacter soli]|uniref:hypothetical protein n=1 Tax=Rathayibacter soli TaxID=3144168 RepID=UPI0027E4C2ED|nr:hypothetical protein [Glaciibacter superstes]
MITFVSRIALLGIERCVLYMIARARKHLDDFRTTIVMGLQGLIELPPFLS